MTPPPTPPPAAPKRSPLRWAVIALAVFFLGVALYTALNPYNERGFVAISHGDHTHYVPEDRDPGVSISNFPTSPPGPDERILPDGRVVPAR